MQEENIDQYEDRRQTEAKHFILQKYLQKFTYILGNHFESISYIDCFSGPWMARDENFKDTSFDIAIEELLKAKKGLKIINRSISLRAFFIEKDSAAYQLLENHIGSKTLADSIDITTKNGKFEEAIPELTKWAGKKNNFTLTFIDPTGWSGYPLKQIAPLLRLQNQEVLINFMIEHIRRFVNGEEVNEPIKQQFSELFGSTDFFQHFKSIEGVSRDELIVQKYCDIIKKEWEYKYAIASPIFNTSKKTIHFYLVFCTRGIK